MNPVYVPWLALIAYWAVSAFRVRPNQKVEPTTTRVMTLLAVAAAFLIVFGHVEQPSVLGNRFLPKLPILRNSGIILTWAGIGFAFWARHSLGEYWSARVTIKVDHKVIDSGPYSLVRHPIYAGILLALIGTAVAEGKWRGIVIFAIIFVAFFFKAKREEQFLSESLGDPYLQYKRRTGMLIPRVRQI